jgi:hypothetical protein
MEHHPSALLTNGASGDGRDALLAAACLHLRRMPAAPVGRDQNEPSIERIGLRERELLEVARRYLAQRTCEPGSIRAIDRAPAFALGYGLAVSVSTLFLIGLIGVLVG